MTNRWLLIGMVRYMLRQIAGRSGQLHVHVSWESIFFRDECIPLNCWAAKGFLLGMAQPLYLRTVFAFLWVAHILLHAYERTKPYDYKNRVMSKLWRLFGVSDRVRHKPGCTTTENYAIQTIAYQRRISPKYIRVSIAKRPGEFYANFRSATYDVYV